jgi:hypothetical protein
MPDRSRKRINADPNVLAKAIVDIVAGEAAEKPPEKNPAAVELGRLGGLKGGPARAKKLSPVKRRAIAKNAAKTRWGKHQTSD